MVLNFIECFRNACITCLYFFSCLTVSVSFPALHVSVSFPALHVSISFPALHVAVSFPALNVSVSFPALHVFISFPALHVFVSFNFPAYQIFEIASKMLKESNQKSNAPGIERRIYINLPSQRPQLERYSVSRKR